MKTFDGLTLKEFAQKAKDDLSNVEFCIRTFSNREWFSSWGNKLQKMELIYYIVLGQADLFDYRIKTEKKYKWIPWDEKTAPITFITTTGSKYRKCFLDDNTVGYVNLWNGYLYTMKDVFTNFKLNNSSPCGQKIEIEE